MYKVFKRLFDVISASLLLIVICPFFLILMLLVKCKLGSPIFFRQIRTGKDMKEFGLFKFRTMTNAKDSNDMLLPDDQRRVPFGSWLRSSSLDELPELINIIKGDMSVIGPRPLYPRYNDYYTAREKMRFEVRGGLIPPEAVDSDPFLSWDKQLEYDAQYVESLSLMTDLRIFFTVFLLLFKRYTQDFGSWNRPPLDIERKKSNNK